MISTTLPLQAHIDLENVVRREPENQEAQGLYGIISQLQEQVIEECQQGQEQWQG